MRTSRGTNKKRKVNVKPTRKRPAAALSTSGAAHSPPANAVDAASVLEAPKVEVPLNGKVMKKRIMSDTVASWKVFGPFMLESDVF